MTAVVMVLHGDAAGCATPCDGQFLAAFDFEVDDGLGLITMTPDATSAKRFPSMADALAFYLTSPACRPTRADGRPNRPLTSTNWEFRPVEDAS